MAKDPKEDSSPAAPAAAAASDNTPLEYRPNRTIHIAEAGKVALSNWIGKVGTRRVRVYRGAQASKIPEPVQKAMQAAGVGIGLVTYAELGLRDPAGPLRPAPSTVPRSELTS